MNGSGNGKRLGSDRGLTFLHAFEQRRLHFRGRTIDLVGKNDIGKNWSGHGREVAAALIEDARPDDIARQKIGRKLNRA